MSAKVITAAEFRRLESLATKLRKSALEIQSAGRAVAVQLSRVAAAIENYKQVELPIDTKGKR